MRSSYRTLGVSFLLSLLLHVILMVLSPEASWMNAQVPEAAENAGEPLEFVLQSPDRPKTIVETPKEGEVDETVESDLLSDINSRASDDVDLPDESDLPHMEGVAPFPSIEAATPRSEPAETRQQGELGEEERGEEDEATARQAKDKGGLGPLRDVQQGGNPDPGEELGKKVGRRASLAERMGIPQAEEEKQERLPSMFDSYSAPMRNPKSTRAGIGGITLNTTAWDFAPYIYDLKNRIVRSWFPPYAFTAMGLIYGHTKVKWRIYPDGHTDGFAVVEQEGHESLHRASLGAVRGAAPFRPLPADFPDPYLEITFGFYYIVPGKNDAPVPLD